MGQTNHTLSRSNRAFLLLLPLALFFAISILSLSRQQFLKDQEITELPPPPPGATGEFDPNAKQAIFNSLPVDSFSELFPNPDLVAQAAVLGESTDEKWIEIDISEQKLFAHNGDKIDYEFLVSTGKWAPTPTGEYRIWIKLRYTLMKGGSKEKHTYYYLPNVPYVQYFYKGYGLHGAYWHNNFGQPMSHGCVNISVPNAEKLFYWTSPSVEEGKKVTYPTKDNPGTRVVIHD